MVSPVDLAQAMPEVIVPPLRELGPAMKALTPKRRKFVLAYMGYGMQKGFGARSAQLAGYKGHDGTLKSNAYQLLRNPDVQAAFHEEIAKLEGAMGWRAKVRLQELVESENEITALSAVKTTLEMTGNMVRRSEMTVRHEIAELPTEELERRISELEKAEIEKRIAARMLTAPIEGEFMVVDGGKSSFDAETESPDGVLVEAHGADGVCQTQHGSQTLSQA